jgi:hypothetical protein
MRMNGTKSGSIPAKRRRALRSAFNHSVIQPLEQRVLFTTFVPGDVAVYTVGNGATALNAASAAVSVLAYSPSGNTLDTTVNLPTAVSGSNNPLTASATTNGEGLLTLSSNGQNLILPGYDAVPGVSNIAYTYTSSPNNSGTIKSASNSAGGVLITFNSSSYAGFYSGEAITVSSLGVAPAGTYYLQLQANNSSQVALYTNASLTTPLAYNASGTFPTAAPTFNTSATSTGVTGNGNIAAQREVGIVSYNGSINTTTTLGSAFSGYSPIGAASVDGTTGVYASGLAATNNNNGGAYYTAIGSTTTPTSILETQNSTRAIEIINGQLYISSNSYNTSNGGPYFIATVGTGTPTTGGPYTPVQLSGLADAGARLGVGGPYAFTFATLNSSSTSYDTLYIADNYNYGVDKYSLVGGTWQITGEAGGTSSGSLAKVTGIVDEQVAGGEQLFVSTPTNLYGLLDSAGYNATNTAFNSASPVLTTVATAPTNDQFRGIAFVPQPGGAPTIYSNPSNVTNDIQGNTATFTAAASGDNLSIQWQVSTNGGVSFSNINNGTSYAGVTDNTLQVLNTTVAESGYEYQAVFTNSAGSVTSTPATLTVKALPTLYFDASSYLVNENAGTVTVNVDRGGGLTGDVVTVAYNTGGGTATAGTNYVAKSGTLTFPAYPTAGWNQQSFTVTIDAVYPQGADKTFNVSLGTTADTTTPTVTPVVVSPSVTTVTIHDLTQNFQFSTSSYTVEQDPTGGTAEFTIVRSEDTADAGSVNYATSDGTATTAAGDYGSTSGTVPFAAGQVYGTFSVPISNSSSQTTNLNFTVSLSTSTSGTIPVNTVFGTNASATETIVATAPLTDNASAIANTTSDVISTGLYTTYPQFLPVDGSAEGGTGSFGYANFGVAEFTDAGSAALYPGPGQTISSLSNLSLELYNSATTGNYGGAVGNFNVYYLANSETTSPTSGLTYQSADVGGLNGQAGAILLGTFSFDNNPVGFDTFTPATLSSTVSNDILAALNGFNPIRLAITPGSTTFGADWYGEEGNFSPTLSLTDNVVVVKPAETVGFNSSSFSIAETAGNTSIAVNRSGTSIGGDSETVTYTFTNGTAVAGTNYNGTSGTLTFGPGVSTLYIPLTAIDVTPMDGDKTFTLTLSNPTPSSSANVGVLGSNSSALVTIVDTSSTGGADSNGDSEVLTEVTTDGSSIETTGPYNSEAGAEESATLNAAGENNTYPSYIALDFNTDDPVYGTADIYTPAATVTAIDSLTLNVFNPTPATETSGPIDVYLVPDAVSNIDPSHPVTKNPHYFNSSKNYTEGLDTTAYAPGFVNNGNGSQSAEINSFGTPMLLGSVTWNATTQTTTAIPLSLTNFSSATEQVLVSDLNNQTKFRLVITPESGSVYANFAGFVYNDITGADLAPTLSIGVQEGTVSTGLPAWVTQQSGTADVWNSSTNVLTVNGPSTIVSDPVTNEPTINDSGEPLTITPSAGDYVSEIHIGTLNLSSGATATISTTTGGGNHVVLVIGSGLSIDATSKLNITDNYLDVQNGSLSAISSLVSTGYAGGAWTGYGIDSSAAAGNTTYLTTVGDILNASGTTAIYSTFDGAPVTTTDVLVKYAYYGDANIDGKVDGSDYTLIDNGFHNHLTGWINGDFNNDGVVDGSDYTLIDNAYNMQGSPIVYTAEKIAGLFSKGPAIVATPVADYGTVSSVSDLYKKGKTSGDVVDSLDAVI